MTVCAQTRTVARLGIGRGGRVHSTSSPVFARTFQPTYGARQRSPDEACPGLGRAPVGAAKKSRKPPIDDRREGGLQRNDRGLFIASTASSYIEKGAYQVAT